MSHHFFSITLALRSVPQIKAKSCTRSLLVRAISMGCCFWTNTQRAACSTFVFALFSKAAGKVQNAKKTKENNVCVLLTKPSWMLQSVCWALLYILIHNVNVYKWGLQLTAASWKLFCGTSKCFFFVFFSFVQFDLQRPVETVGPICWPQFVLKTSLKFKMFCQEAFEQVPPCVTSTNTSSLAASLYIKPEKSTSRCFVLL